MIPLALVTGFLGSGKTTLLARLAREVGADVISLPGGSIFCKCLAGEFVARMRELAARAAAAAAALEGVVIEASGMADPRVILALLAETGLDRSFRLASVIAVLDPDRFLKLIHTLPAIRAQVEAADVVILNRTDRCDPAQVLAAEAAVRAIRPAADLRRAVFCDTPLELFPAAPPLRHPSGDYARCRDPNFVVENVALDAPLHLESFATALAAAADDVYRLKGRAVCGAGDCCLDFAGGALERRPARPGGPHELVFILRGAGAERARRLLVDPLRRGAFAVRASRPEAAHAE